MDAAQVGGSSHLRIRAELMDALRAVIQGRGLRQRDAAALFGVAQPRVSDLVRGKLELFSIDTLVDMLVALEVRVEFTLRPMRRLPRHGVGRAGDSVPSAPSVASPAPHDSPMSSEAPGDRQSVRSRRRRSGGSPAG